MAEVEQEFKEITLSVPWGHVAARTYGSPIGKRVLVIHGRLDNLGSFTRLMKYLPKESFYYVCIDLPGHGWSSHFPSWMMIDTLDYAHALHFILDALQWETCICIGHSMGAYIVLLFSVFQPNRIEKLISLDGILLNIMFKKLPIYFTKASEFSLIACRDEISYFTREEILNILKSIRFGGLNSEAAEAIFERAVTEVDGKYIFNRDIRLKNHPFSFMGTNDCQKFTGMFSIPIYLCAASDGIILPYKDHKEVLDLIKTKTVLELTIVDGNHDVHNNSPEKVAPFICKILNNEYTSKL